MDQIAPIVFQAHFSRNPLWNACCSYWISRYFLDSQYCQHQEELMIPLSTMISLALHFPELKFCYTLKKILTRFLVIPPLEARSESTDLGFRWMFGLRMFRIGRYEFSDIEMNARLHFQPQESMISRTYASVSFQRDFCLYLLQWRKSHSVFSGLFRLATRHRKDQHTLKWMFFASSLSFFYWAFVEKPHL